MDSKERIDRLTDQLKEAGYRYYVLDDPTMEDYEYDRLYRELEELENAHPELARADSPTKRVGGEVLSQFEKVSHPVPLMSLQDVFSMEELNDFLEKTIAAEGNAEFSVEPKIDGLSVALLLAKSDVYDEMEAKLTCQGVFTLAKPTSALLLNQSLKWLVSARERLRRMEEKATSVEEKMEEIRLVNRAKWLLIEQLKMTEAEAHRHIEKQAMDRCTTRREIALGIIKTYA